ELERELIADLAPVLEELVTDHLASLLHDADAQTVKVLTGPARMTRGSLLGLARAATSDLDARLLPEDAPFDEAMAQYGDALARFEALWRGGGRAAAQGLLEAAIAEKALDGRRYSSGSPSKQAMKLDALLGGALPTKLVEDSGAAAYFSAERIAASTKKGSPLSHPVFDGWDEVRAAARALLPTLHVPRRRFALWAREELATRLSTAGLVSFDALVRALARGLSDPATGPGLAAAIGRRFDAALLDEFQDTDAEQWTIFSKVFEDPERFLYLIGDPKQGIYGFRGADVHVYAAAARRAGDGRRFTMDVNHRSDARYIDAMNAAFAARDDLFDLDFVKYVEVGAAPRNADDRVRFDDHRAPLRLRYFDGTTDGASDRRIGKSRASELVPALVAEDVLEALERGEIRDGEGFRRVAPRDIAVLVRKNAQALEMQDALAVRGIPSVVGNSGSVFASEEALLFDR
ncbi:MAG: UvrD-helicase domain-containing protein, partial [Polyangiaceae bacterium]|nr:UvrD-helicase domain-containing protein [Polyangiaceae bacterium]